MNVKGTGVRLRRPLKLKSFSPTTVIIAGKELLHLLYIVTDTYHSYHSVIGKRNTQLQRLIND